MRKPKVGDYITTWWRQSDVWTDGENIGRILAVRPYTGMYPKFSDLILTITAPETSRGSIEMAYDSSDFILDRRRKPCPQSSSRSSARATRRTSKRSARRR